ARTSSRVPGVARLSWKICAAVVSKGVMRASWCSCLNSFLLGNGWAARRVERRAAMDPTAGLRAGFWRPFPAVGRSSDRQHMADDVVALGLQHANLPSQRGRPGICVGPFEFQLGFEFYDSVAESAVLVLQPPDAVCVHACL